MKIGRFNIEQLSEGQFFMFEDGTFQKSDSNDDDDDKHSFAGLIPHKKPLKVGINPILVSSESEHIMLDTGVGWGLDAGSSYKDASNVKTNLDIFDRKPEDITHVVLSHLHYDHSAGCTYSAADSSTTPTFPNATYYIQRKEWDYALSLVGKDNPLKGADYRLDDLYRLIADDRVVLWEDELVDLVDGVKIICTGGHTPGHQAVIISDEGQSAYYLGDLLPNEHHLNRYKMQLLDKNPLIAKKMKIRLMRQAYRENAYLLFYHSLFSRVGRLDKDDKKKYVLKD